MLSSILLISLFASSLSYLPSTDLTNSIYSSQDKSAEEVEGSSETEEVAQSPYRNKLTFRRRNINAGSPYVGSGPSPFSRMSYKAGYGSSRLAGRQNFRSAQTPVNNNFYNYYGNPYGYNSGMSSELLGGQKNMGYFGSTAAMRKRKFRPYDFTAKASSNFNPSNDLMKSFQVPSPDYRNPKFPKRMGAAGSFIPRFPDAGRFPDLGGYQIPYDYSPYRGDLDNYSNHLFANQWNGKGLITSKDTQVDGFAKEKTFF